MSKILTDISIVLGSKNRKNLLKATINSIRENGFTGKMEIIVVDGGSTDGTCNWLAQQKDIFTIIQPNYRITDKDGISVLAHSWGNFMNIAFKHAKAPWVVMLSDDLILAKGALNNGFNELNARINNGEKIGGGAFFFREYPRHNFYRIGLLQNNYITINHGFYYKKALQDVNFIDEHNYNFYCADGDLSIRLNERGWKTIALNNAFADHLVHIPKLTKKTIPKATIRDISFFNKKYPDVPEVFFIKKEIVLKNNTSGFWRHAFINCLLGYLLKFNDKYKLI